MRQNRETLALHAYMTLLERKGLNPQHRIQHEFVIVRLSRYLAKLSDANGRSYRQAVDTFVQQLEPAERPQAILVARAFFAFWMQDIKTIAAMMTGEAFTAQQQSGMDSDALFKQWFNLDAQALLAFEQRLLRTFQQNCQVLASVDPCAQDDMGRIAKFLVLQLRGIHLAHAYAYRSRIDGLMPLFNALGQQSQFLQVARHLYEGWRHQLASMPAREIKAPVLQTPQATGAHTTQLPHAHMEAMVA